MRKISKFIKPFIYTTLGVGTCVGGLYLYNSLQSKEIKIQKDNQLNVDQYLQNIQTNIKALIDNEPHHIGTAEQIKQFKQEKQQSYIHKQTQTQNKQNHQHIAQLQSTKQSQAKKDSQSSSHPQKSENQQNVSLENQKQPKKTQNPQLTQQKSKHSIDISKVRRLSQLPQLPFQPKQKLDQVIIVSDIGFTQQFQQKLLETIKNIQKNNHNQQIPIYRANILKDQVKQTINKKYNVKLKDQTIFLIKNSLDQSLINIDFDMYMQFPSIISTYMTKLNPYDSSNQNDYLKKLEKMSPNQSYLMFVYDDTQPQAKRAQRLLAAKYIEMQLVLHHLDHAIKVIPIQASVAKDNKIIPTQKIRPNSIHIIRKHNEFTHASPNLHLKLKEDIIPFHLIADVGFHNKRGEVAIQSYLSKIQTFNSLSITTPYVLSLTIDKNRVTTDNYKTLMNTFKDIKRKNKHPEVGIALKFSEVGYLGRNQTQNQQFSIKIANVAELENQSYMHQIQKIQDAQNIGITQKNWLMNSNEYLYPHQVISEELLTDFIQKVLLNQFPQYYRSDKPSTIQNVHKIVASNFEKQIMQNNLDHFVFQYTDHCPSCKMISPLIGYMNQILQPIPVQLRFDIHRMNCQKNRVKSQIYSPYTPNMNYFKNQWKHTGPVRIGLQTISHSGLAGLYDFCVITKLLKTIDNKKFNQAIQNSKGWDKKQFVL